MKKIMNAPENYTIDMRKGIYAAQCAGESDRGAYAGYPVVSSMKASICNQ